MEMKLPIMMPRSVYLATLHMGTNQAVPLTERQDSF